MVLEGLDRVASVAQELAGQDVIIVAQLGQAHLHLLDQIALGLVLELLLIGHHRRGRGDGSNLFGNGILVVEAIKQGDFALVTGGILGFFHVLGQFNHFGGYFAFAFGQAQNRQSHHRCQ